MADHVGQQRLTGCFGGEMTPDAAWEELQANPSAVLVDVRTDVEWAFVGLPNLSSVSKSPWLLSWRLHPGMVPNQSFVEALTAQVAQSGASTVLMLCRSGARSLEAAYAATNALSAGEVPADEAADGVRTVTFWNVKEGFEGDLDETRQRGRLNGWKARGLPWAQS